MKSWERHSCKHFGRILTLSTQYLSVCPLLYEVRSDTWISMGHHNSGIWPLKFFYCQLCQFYGMMARVPIASLLGQSCWGRLDLLWGSRSGGLVWRMSRGSGNPQLLLLLSLFTPLKHQETSNAAINWNLIHLVHTSDVVLTGTCKSAL